VKLIANMILTAAVIAGSLAATTAYLAPLSLSDEALIGLTLNSTAGLIQSADGTSQPIAQPNEVVTAEVLAELRANEYIAKGTPQKISYITVKEFSFGRWQGKWIFLASLAGLIVGAMMIRTADKREIATATSGAAAGSTNSPQATFQSICDTISTLHRDLPGMESDHDRLTAIIHRIEELQKTHITAFIDARAILINKLRLGGYAEMMDRFAAAERQINRAWSTAADGYLSDSMQSLNLASTLLEEAAAKLG
jgi:hypothetical protein